MDYKLYFTNAAGHIIARVDLECRDDDHAIEVAAQHLDGRDMELWRRDRVVKVFATSDPQN